MMMFKGENKPLSCRTTGMNGFHLNKLHFSWLVFGSIQDKQSVICPPCQPKNPQNNKHLLVIFVIVVKICTQTKSRSNCFTSTANGYVILGSIRPKPEKLTTHNHTAKPPNNNQFCSVLINSDFVFILFFSWGRGDTVPWGTPFQWCWPTALSYPATQSTKVAHCPHTAAGHPPPPAYKRYNIAQKVHNIFWFFPTKSCMFCLLLILFSVQKLRYYEKWDMFACSLPVDACNGARRNEKQRRGSSDCTGLSHRFTESGKTTPRYSTVQYGGWQMEDAFVSLVFSKNTSKRAWLLIDSLSSWQR